MTRKGTKMAKRDLNGAEKTKDFFLEIDIDIAMMLLMTDTKLDVAKKKIWNTRKCNIK